MKKIVFAAAALLLMVCATSCESGKCACIGFSTKALYDQANGSAFKADIQVQDQMSGMSSKQTCNNIKDRYPNAYAMACEENKTVDEILAGKEE